MQKLIAADSFEYSMVEFTVEIILLGIMVGFSTSCAILFAAFVLTIMIIQLWPSYGNFIIVQELNLHLVAIYIYGDIPRHYPIFIDMRRIKGGAITITPKDLATLKQFSRILQRRE